MWVCCSGHWTMGGPWCLFLRQGGIGRAYALIDAVREGHWGVLRWWHNSMPEAPLTGTPKLCAWAAEKGQLEVLRWLQEIGCCADEEAYGRAATAGHLEILQWLKEQECPMNSNLCALAAKYGNLQVLKWAREQGCPWKRTCAAAAEGGHLGLLQWAKENGCP